MYIPINVVLLTSLMEAELNSGLLLLRLLGIVNDCLCILPRQVLNLMYSVRMGQGVFCQYMLD